MSAFCIISILVPLPTSITWRPEVIVPIRTPPWIVQSLRDSGVIIQFGTSSYLMGCGVTILNTIPHKFYIFGGIVLILNSSHKWLFYMIPHPRSPCDCAPQSDHETMASFHDNRLRINGDDPFSNLIASSEEAMWLRFNWGEAWGSGWVEIIGVGWNILLLPTWFKLIPIFFPDHIVMIAIQSLRDDLLFRIAIAKYEVLRMDPIIGASPSLGVIGGVPPLWGRW
jgi:hypothetical protein